MNKQTAGEAPRKEARDQRSKAAQAKKPTHTGGVAPNDDVMRAKKRTDAMAVSSTTGPEEVQGEFYDPAAFGGTDRSSRRRQNENR